MRMQTQISLAQVEVIRNALVGVTEVMSTVLRRTAHSTNIKERMDFSCALYDAGLQTVAQAFAMPMHLSSMALAVRQAMEIHGGELPAGDSLVFNYVPLGGIHLNDICVLSPVHVDGELLGYVANIAHHVDVGGMSAGSISLAESVYQEGIVIPPVRLEVAGSLNRDVVSVLTGNVRMPGEMFGDLTAQLGSNRIGAQRFADVASRWSVEALREAMEFVITSTQKEAESAIATLPDGVYEAEGQLDDDGVTGEPIRLKVRITVDGERIVFDTTGSDAQRPSPMGATYASTFSSCAFALKAVLMPDATVNEGLYRAIDVIAEPGSALYVTHPGAIAGGGELCQTFVDVLIRAFGEAVPDKAIAQCKGCLGNIAFGGVDPRNGEQYAFYETIGGGYGARGTLDGLDAVQTHMSNSQNAPVEIVETQYPVRIDRYELIPDSSGDGEFRGGLGIRRDYSFDHPVSFSILSDRAVTGPQGIFGGGDARKAHYILNPGRPGETAVPSKGTFDVRPGDVVSIQTPGGGGYGDPARRSAERRATDARQGKVTSTTEAGR
jgi:N-methylhydantoinase B